MIKFFFTPTTYKELCITLDSILLSCRCPFVISIEWLHVLRPHTVLLNRYIPLYTSFFHHLSSLVIDIAKNILIIVFDFFCSLFSRYNFLPYFDPSKPPDIIFVTHLLDPAHLDSPIDFYYGSLGNKLSRDGHSVLFLFINHTQSSLKHLRLDPEDASYDRVILPVGRDSIFLLIGSLVWSIKSTCRLFFFLPRLRNYRQLLSLLFSASNSFSRGSRLGYFIHHCIKRLVNSSTKCVVTTFEGFAWERILISSCHDANPSISTLAYMHALVFKGQHSVFRELGPRYDPKYILTAGSTTRSFLINNMGISDSRVLQLGSPRAVVSSKIFSETSSPPLNPTLLVLPEGIVQDCLSLFRFSLNCAFNFPNVIFRWRTHPLVSLKSVVQSISRDHPLPPNVVLSESSFESDIRTSQYCLYRGSTAVVTAASSGLIPIYYQSSDFPDTDPLFSLSSYRPSISNALSLSNVLQWKSWGPQAISLCQELYTPLDPTFFSRHGLL